MSWLELIRDYEFKILTFMNAGQEQNDRYVARPKGSPGFGPTHSFPLVPLEEALIPLGVYIAMILYGILFLKENRVLLPKNLIYNLKFIYNFVQIFLCSYMSVAAMIFKYRHSMSLYHFSHKDCVMFSAVDPVLHNLLWLFYISKVLDFVDTFFIIVSGKPQQFSFLHLYHHLSIFLVYWINVNVAYDGEIVGTVIYNAGVHTIMYTYYLISMHAENVWWKKYVTQIQLIQFVLMITNGSSIFISRCAIPDRVSFMYVSYIISLLILFLRFYASSYSRPDKSNKTQKKE